MKKRILSLVLCAVMLLSMCLFMGAGVTQDAAEAAGEVPQTAVFTEAGPFRPAVSVRPQPLRAAADRAAGGDGLELSKEVTANGSGYTVHLEAYTTARSQRRPRSHRVTSCSCSTSPARWRIILTGMRPARIRPAASMP